LLSRRTVCAAAVVGLAAAGLVGAPANPARAAGCTSPSVAVVVDFGHFGGGVQRGCVAPGGTGLQVLAAVFGVTQVQREPGFVCRINGLPTKAQDACVNTPPSNAYWAYFHGRAGSGWVYSAAGAGTYVPPPGTVDGWAFGGGASPGVSVASVLPAKVAPPPTHTRPKPTPGPTHRASKPPGTSPAATPAATSATAHSTSGRPKSSGSTSPSAPPTSGAATGSDPPTVQDVTRPPPKAAGSGSGSAAPLVVAVALAAALFAGGWYLSRRRRLSQ
jgi:hypothetical protein